MKKVIVGMSGGVDSSVAAWVLMQSGYTVEGLFMKNWEEDDDHTYCAASADLSDVESVCAQLNIPLHTVNFSTEYWDQVFEVFLEQLQLGYTPNPDILCNREIKFKVLLKFARENLGADLIATGHYAQREQIGPLVKLCRARDTDKDQTYFLYALEQYQLQHTLFPIGHLKKIEVRRIAGELGLITAKKRDSMGICFIGKRNFAGFISKYLSAKPGPIQDTQGTVLGQHQGLYQYTIGQRQGIGIGGRKGYGTAPWYVVQKDTLNNRLVVTQKAHDKQLYHNAFTVKNLHWIAGKPSVSPFFCTMKARHRQQDVNCRIVWDDEKALGYVVCDVPQRALTLGQAAVFYHAPYAVGGGTIASVKTEALDCATLPSS